MPRPPKRKVGDVTAREHSSETPKELTKEAKKPRTARSGRGVTKGKEKVKTVWPEYFNSLFKVYKALNTVLAFCSSRKNLATTFPVVRSSVEGLLKQPLELPQVAELKALLPDLIQFAYIPQNDLRINGLSQSEEVTRRRDESPDLFAALSSSSHLGSMVEDEEHVLILEFAENLRGKKGENPGFGYTVPPSLTPAGLKKLIEKRNRCFCRAVDELLLATPSTEDPVAILISAGQDHVPINPSSKLSLTAFSDVKGKGNNIIPDSKNRASINDIISEIQTQPWYQGQIVERRIIEAKEGQLAQLDPPLSGSVSRALADSRKITTLYTHQVEAITALSKGKNVIVSTSTASGKSVIYHVPLLQFLEEDLTATAMFIYPTKALAQDQRAALEQLIYSCPGLQNVKVATYDGDTPQELRAVIRETASVIFTNFDMIHASILPHEDLWRRFLKNIKLVAVDELHYYSNLFGSHVAQILRRFRRVCAAVGNRHSRFVSCSATISSPRRHMQNIFGIDDIEEITKDGAPSGPKNFIIWNPQYIDSNQPSLGRHSSLSEATGLMRFLMKRGVRVILFCKIRKVCELAMKSLRASLSSEGRLDILERTMAYRGGYSQEDRRRIEREAFSGSLLGIVATNALELGVDIGVLDAVIMLGFPINIASFRQQAGRAGRRARDSLAVLVADSLPIDQHYVDNPQELFDQCVDDLVVDLESKVILEAHLQCAGQEMPLSLDDEKYFGPLTRELCETKLTKDKDGWYHTHPRFLPFPSKYISIRGAQEEKYALVDISKVGKPGGSPHIIEEVEISRALFEIYEGGVFIHQGLTFIVKEVSHDTKVAKIIRADVSWITQPRDFTNVDAVQTFRIREMKQSSHHIFYGRVEVTTKVFGFFKIRNNTILDVVDLDTEPWERETTGFWIDVPYTLLGLLESKGINAAAAIHSAQHAFLNRFVMANDLRTECKAPEKEFKVTESRRKRPARLIFYDSVSKGGGVAVKAFDHGHDILGRACAAIKACNCEEGCDKCVHSPGCREGNEVSSKIGALLILRTLLALEVDPDEIPPQINPATFGTIVTASSVRTVEGLQIEKDVS